MIVSPDRVCSANVRGGTPYRVNLTDYGNGTYAAVYNVAAGTYTVSLLLAAGNGLTGRYYNNRWLQVRVRSLVHGSEFECFAGA